MPKLTQSYCLKEHVQFNIGRKITTYFWAFQEPLKCIYQPCQIARWPRLRQTNGIQLAVSERENHAYMSSVSLIKSQIYTSRKEYRLFLSGEWGFHQGSNYESLRDSRLPFTNWSKGHHIFHYILQTISFSPQRCHISYFNSTNFK